MDVFNNNNNNLFGSTSLRWYDIVMELMKNKNSDNHIDLFRDL